MSGNTLASPCWTLRTRHEPMCTSPSCSAQGHPVLGIGLSVGGALLWPDLEFDDVEGFTDCALVEHHIILTTSSNYTLTLPGFIRFSIGLPSTTVEQNVQMVGQILSGWRQR